MIVIKEFPLVPFGHRQHMHSGHCQYIHGHSLRIRLAFGCTALDERGFVIDFGGLDYPKEIIKSLDHAMLVSLFDIRLAPRIAQNDAAFQGLFKPILLPTPSIEGIAWWLMKAISLWAKEASDNRVFLAWVELTEDNRNTITFYEHDVEMVEKWMYTEFDQQKVVLDAFIDQIKLSVKTYVKDRGPYLNG